MPTFGHTPNVHASAARTTSGQTAALPTENARTLSLLVDVTAASGTTPSVTFSVEWSHDGTNWFQGDPADVFSAITGASKRAKAFQVKAAFYRVVYTITGTTPSLTFAVHGYLA